MNYCPSCGQKLEGTAKFCSNCGNRLATIEPDQPVKNRPIEVQEPKPSPIIIERGDRGETTYYSDNKGVRVTSTRLVIPGKTAQEGPSTYTMANITSVKTMKIEPNRWGGILAILIGIAIFIIGVNSESESWFWIGSIVLVVSGLGLAVFKKPTYFLRISSASGETDALPSQDKAYMDRIVTGINEAIMKRG